MEEIGFNWGEYLEETGASAAPHASFRHVRMDISPLCSAREGWGGERCSRKRPDPSADGKEKGREIQPRLLRNRGKMGTLICFRQMAAGSRGLPRLTQGCALGGGLRG